MMSERVRVHTGTLTVIVTRETGKMICKTARELTTMPTKMFTKANGGTVSKMVKEITYTNETTQYTKGSGEMEKKVVKDNY